LPMDSASLPEGWMAMSVTPDWKKKNIFLRQKVGCRLYQAFESFLIVTVFILLPGHLGRLSEYFCNSNNLLTYFVHNSFFI
jgi:hypothetical protein